MISNSIMHIISQYNEKGVFVQKANKTYWFNGKRFEIWNKMTPKFDYPCMIQIQIDTKTHSYILSKYEISHFNGERWTNSKINSLPVIETIDCGTIYYIASYDRVISRGVVNDSQTKNHGILYCSKSCKWFSINLDGELSLFTNNPNNPNNPNYLSSLFKCFGKPNEKNHFYCSGHWKL